MSLKREAESTLREAQRDLAPEGADAHYFAYPAGGAVQYPCLPSALERGTQIEIGGNPVTIGLTLTYLVDDFAGAAEPVSGHKITYKGIDHKVIVPRRSAPGSHVVLVLADKDSAR